MNYTVDPLRAFDVGLLMAAMQRLPPLRANEPANGLAQYAVTEALSARVVRPNELARLADVPVVNARPVQDFVQTYQPVGAFGPSPALEGADANDSSIWSLLDATVKLNGAVSGAPKAVGGRNLVQLRPRSDERPRRGVRRRPTQEGTTRSRFGCSPNNRPRSTCLKLMGWRLPGHAD